MLSILHRYIPGRLVILLFTENALILMGLLLMVSAQVHLLGTGAFGRQNLPAGIALTLVCQLAFYYVDLYDLRAMKSIRQVLGRMLIALGAVCLLLAMVVYISPQIHLNTGVLELSFSAIIFGVFVWRLLLDWGMRSFAAADRILLVGSGATVADLAREINARSDLPITLVGSVAEDSLREKQVSPHVTCVGTLATLKEVIDEVKPHRVVIALEDRRQHLPVDTLLECRLRGLVVEEASTLYQKLTGKIPLESIRPSELIFSDGFRTSLWLRLSKRSFELMASGIAIAVFGPVILLIALAVKLDSRGPVLYRQVRVGRRGKQFELIKFRSMYVDAEKIAGPQWTCEDDARITRVGRVIRKMHLDELPQFFNILRGDMSFVGPRPERPHFVEQLKQQVPYYDLRHSVRTGLTGWAQVSYPYGASVIDAKRKLEYDLFYTKNMSISLDLLIMFHTVKIILSGRGAR